MRSASDLQSDLDECAWEVMNEDDLSQGCLQDGFEVSLSCACLLVSLKNSAKSMIRKPPGPFAGRTMTSTAASSGNSSRRVTSMGPFTDPMTE